MKTKNNIRKATTALALAIALSGLSLQASAQSCQAGFTFGVNTNTVTFTNTSTGASMPTYYWNFGDGSNDWQVNPQHVFAANGTYNVCLLMYDSLNSGCQSTYCANVTITNAPTPPCSAVFSYQKDTANVIGGGMHFYAGNAVSWTWDFGDGSVGTGQNPFHAYAQTGNYIVCLTITDAFGQTCTNCDTIAYVPCTVVAGFTANTSADPQISFTNTTTGASAAFCSWSFGDGSYAYSANASHTYQYSGLYTVCLSVYDSLSGCTDSYCDTISINNGTAQPCVAQFYSFPDSNNTFPGTIQFYDYSTGGATSWYWTFGDGSTSTQQHPTHTYAQSGAYQVCLTITTAAGTCSSCSTVTVNTNPSSGCSASMYLVQDTTSANGLTWYAYTYVTGTAPFTYLWNFGDGSTSTQQYPSHTYAQPGSYLICLTITDATGCTSTTCDSAHKLMSGNMQNLVVVNTTGVAENVSSISDVHNYPNPFSGTTRISYTLDKNSDVQIAVYDRLGSKVAELENSRKAAGSHELEWNAADMPAGIYHLELKAGSNSASRKLVVTK